MSMYARAELSQEKSADMIRFRKWGITSSFR
jgi:hypothetical protein